MKTDSGRLPHIFLCFFLLFGLMAAMIASVSFGSVSISFWKVIRIIFNHFSGGEAGGWSLAENQIVWVFRFPRTLLAAVVGAGLAACGAALQAVARNPLADPYIFGVSSGASAAAVAFLTLGSGGGGLSLAGAAFSGALATTVLVYLLAQQGGRVSPMRLVLSGVALGYVLSAVTSFLV